MRTIILPEGFRPGRGRGLSVRSRLPPRCRAAPTCAREARDSLPPISQPLRRLPATLVVVVALEVKMGVGGIEWC